MPIGALILSSEFDLVDAEVDPHHQAWSPPLELDFSTPKLVAMSGEAAGRTGEGEEQRYGRDQQRCVETR